MPIDLDDMFTTLGRHADTIPLAPVERAQRRGEQRTRTTVAAAAAVCLIATGIGAVVVRHERQSPQVSSKRGLPSVGAPIEFGDQARASTAAGADGRLYAAWQTLDGRISLTAVDLDSGAVAWPAREVGSRTDTLGSVNAYRGTLMVMLDHADTAEAGSVLQIYDTADGRLRWELPYQAGDALVPHESVLVWMSAKTGRTEAFDWVTGDKRWQLPAPADRPIRTAGTYLDENWTFALGRPTPFTDDRLVQVTRSGKVQVRDIATGGLLRTVTGAPPEQDPSSFIVYGDWLYSEERECCDQDGYRVRRTDLRTARGSSAVVLSQGDGHQLNGLQPCGDQRICVIDQDRDLKTTLTVFDLPGNRRLWQVVAPEQAGSVATVPGYTLVSGSEGDRVVYDRDGRLVFSTPGGQPQWLDQDTLLLLPDLVGGPARKVSLPDGRITQLGEVPARSDACAWTRERLACPAVTSLRIWSLTG
jgi:outer membrane protein assembly factor BamB